MPVQGMEIKQRLHMMRLSPNVPLQPLPLLPLISLTLLPLLPLLSLLVTSTTTTTVPTGRRLQREGRRPSTNLLLVSRLLPMPRLLRLQR